MKKCHRIACHEEGDTSYIEAECRNIEPKVLGRIIIQAVCNKNIDEIIQNLFCDIRNKITVDIEAHFDSTEHFLERNKQTRNFYYFCIYCKI